MKINNTNVSLKKLIKYISKTPLHLVYFLSYLFPRNKKIWVFGSKDGRQFLDNPKYLFLYIANNRKDEIKAIWISKNRTVIKKLRKKGYNAYHNCSLRGIYYALRAYYFITDGYSFAINYWLSGGAKKINLWHGSPIKKIGFDMTKGKGSEFHKSKGVKKLMYYLLVPWVFEKQGRIITTSPLYQKIFISAFKINRNKIAITGYPRNDIFFNKFDNFDLGMDYQIFRKIKKFKKDNNKLIIYLPTFRESGGNPCMDGVFDFTKLNRFLNLNHTIFIVKLHILTDMKRNISQDLNLDRILVLPRRMDIYSILPLIDVLITDYSSVYFDFLLLNKPIIFFPYDIQQYINERDLYFNYDEFTPGPKAYNFGELLEKMKDALDGNDDYIEQRQKIRDLCFQYKDGNASKRIFELLSNKIRISKNASKN